MSARRALWMVIGISLVLRLAMAATLGVYGNESYYYMYAYKIDWGYFDHPPMVGVVAALGLGLAGGFLPIFGLRVVFVVLFAGSSWLLARLTERMFGSWAGVMAVLGLNATLFYGLKVGTLAEPDGLLLFFWLLTLDCLWVALEDPRRNWAWLGVGLGWGLALLSKYHAVLLVVGAGLYLLLRPETRRCLRLPGPYLALATGLVLFAPVIGWNASHGWVSFIYQGTRASGFEGLHSDTFIEAIVGQVLYLTPWIWARLGLILVRIVRRGCGDWDTAEAFLVCQAVPALALFVGVSTFRRIMPHWPLIGFVALLPMLGHAWAELLAASPRRFGFRLTFVTAAPVLFGLLFVLHARTGLLQDGRGRLLGVFSPVSDPTVDTIRWVQIARELERRGLLGDPNTFLFTNHWRFSAELAMATHRGEPVACFHRDARSFALWSRPDDWVGRDGLFVDVDDGLVEVSDYIPWFTRIEPLGSIPIVRAGVVLQEARLYRCVRQVHPFAFGYDGPGPIPRPVRDRGDERPMLGRVPGSQAL